MAHDYVIVTASVNNAGDSGNTRQGTGTAIPQPVLLYFSPIHGKKSNMAGPFILQGIFYFRKTI